MRWRARLWLWLLAATGRGAGRLLDAKGSHCCREALKPGFAERPASEPWWPQDCDWQRHIFHVGGKAAAAAGRQGDQRTLQAILQKACQGWRALAGQQEVLAAGVAAPPKVGLAGRLAAVALPLMPYGRMSWAQFAALYAQYKLCLAWNADSLIQGEGRRQCAGRNETDCDCLSVVRENLDFLFGALPARALAPSSFVGRLLHTFGQWWLSPRATPFQKELGVAARREVWGRFLLRQNKTRPGERALEEQMAWAKAMMEQALGVAVALRGMPSAAALLDFAGAARARVADPAGRNFQWGSRRTGALVKSIVTPFVGTSVYPGLWRETLLRRLARGREPFFGPDAGEADRRHVCAATVTSVELPWQDCHAVIAPLGAKIDGPADDRVAGVQRLGDRCRVVLNRALAQSVLDGVILGEDCAEWYGQSHVILGLPANFKLWALMFHSSPLAIDIVQRTLLERELRSYHAAAEDLRGRLACRAEGEPLLSFVVPHPAWAALLRHVAAIYWYVLNTMPYERGSSTTGILIHHALLMAVFPARRQQLAALGRCVPLFRAQLLPDWEALAAPLEEFVSEVYSTLFEGSLEPSCFHGALVGRDDVLL